MSKAPPFQTKEPPIYAKAFPTRRAMVAYRDGKLYVDSTKNVAHIQDRNWVQHTGASDGKPRNGG